MLKKIFIIQVASVTVATASHASNFKQFFSSGGSKAYKCQEFTASGTWVRPSGVETVDLFLVGGGGGGGSAATSADKICGGGGGGGEVLKKPVSVAGNVTVTIGAGGAGATGAAAGSPGEASSFGAIVARGGGGGESYWNARYSPTAAVTSGGASSHPAAYVLCGPGGGAGGSARLSTLGGLPGSSSVYSTSLERSLGAGSGGIAFASSTSGFNLSEFSGGLGIDGYGGGGSAYNFSLWASVFDGGAAKNAAAGANTGGGGSGGYAAGGSSSPGYSGGSGFARVCWWE